MNIIRVDVDTQNGFCSPDGNLYVPDPGGVLDNVRALVDDATESGVPIIGSVDSHAYDAWEFVENGGPFPAHCVKGTSDWLKIDGTLPARFRFIPMTTSDPEIGEDVQGRGNRRYTERMFSEEARAGVGLYFEKEVYSAFANTNADNYIERLVEDLGGADNVIFQVFGYCWGGFCSDSFALELAKRGYRVQAILDAGAAIDGANGPDGLEYSRKTLTEAGIECITTEDALRLTAA